MNDLLEKPRLMDCESISFMHWINQMEDAQVESKRVWKLNEPTVKENSIRKAENLKPGENHKKMLSMPFKVDQWSQDILQREAGRMLRLAKIRPEEWQKRIFQVDEIAQGHVARIIWWDFFGDVEVNDRWPHLDRWIKMAFNEIPIEDLITGLNVVGYSPWQIKKRLNF
jgi:hypothetical protein